MGKSESSLPAAREIVNGKWEEKEPRAIIHEFKSEEQEQFSHRLVGLERWLRQSEEICLWQGKW